jgi:hypothetical protein
MSDLLIEYRDNRTGHRDIHFHVGDYSCIADSYYLALDISNDDPDGSVEGILVQLLKHWLEVLQHADSTHPVFLPYDFSDQYIGCLKCVVKWDAIRVQPGWSSRCGHSVSPSKPGDFFYGIEDFSPSIPEPLQLSREDFVSQINESIAQAQRQLPTSQSD